MRIGPSIKPTLREDFFSIAMHAGVCEFIVEAWDPDVADQRDFLETLRSDVRLLPHCISLNILGDGPSERSRERVKKWIDLLQLDWIGDHYSWSGLEGQSTGLAIPPQCPLDECIQKVESIRTFFGTKLILENIATPYDSANHVYGYHYSLSSCLRATGCALLLDIENIRIDAENSGMTPVEILSFYDGLVPEYLHISGGGFNGILQSDNHDRSCGEKTLDLLESRVDWNGLDVIYERDFEIDMNEIREELQRLEKRFVNGPVGL